DEMRRLRASASGKELEIINRAVALMESFERQPDSFPTRFPELVQILRDVVDMGGDVETQRQLVATFTILPATAKNFGLESTDLRTEAVARARALVARFPKDGRSYGVLATALAEADAPDSEVKAAFTKCVELDPTAQNCVEAQERARAAERAPRCSTLKPSFALRAGADSLTAADVLSTSFRDEGIDLVLTEVGAKKLETFTERLARTRGSMDLTVDNAIIFSAAIMEPITDGRLHVSPGQQEPMALLERLCVQVVRQ
ncbi:MAG TPA: hypothetical protein VLC93_13185, partial [Myxococcota bacterium]|nr:hypothetical protein [Myxococcota bacterium]